MSESFRQVILIDDDPVSLFLITKIISHNKIADTIYPFTNGISALEYLSKNAQQVSLLPELIITDIRMPGMNGLQLLEAINNINFNDNWQPLICAMSAEQTKLSEAQHQKFSVTEHFVKPVRANKLISVIESFISQQKSFNQPVF